ncbi:MAG TPA: hypothetical protein VK438_09660 [Xanthobacteraceae bacterium]|nr:hypothetical protein [Xanthobacteraceae bacterium]
MAKDYRGFVRRIRQLYFIYHLLPTTWQLAIVGVLSAVGSYLGFEAGGLFYAFIGLVVAFATSAMGIFFVLMISRSTTTYMKIGIGGIGIGNVAADIKLNVVKEIYAITLQVSVQNTGVRDVWFKVLRSDLSILNTVNQDAKISDDLHLVPTGFPQLLNIATIEHIKVPKYDPGPHGRSPIVGKLKLELAYGSRKDHLSYDFEYEADLTLTWNITTTEKSSRQNAQFAVMNSIKRNSHGHRHGS